MDIWSSLDENLEVCNRMFSMTTFILNMYVPWTEHDWLLRVIIAKQLNMLNKLCHRPFRTCSAEMQTKMELFLTFVEATYSHLFVFVWGRWKPWVPSRCAAQTAFYPSIQINVENRCHPRFYHVFLLVVHTMAVTCFWRMLVVMGQLASVLDPFASVPNTEPRRDQDDYVSAKIPGF